MKRSIIFFLLFILLFVNPVLSQPRTKAQMSAKMQEIKNDLSNQVAELEKQITTAKKENPEKVKGLEEKLAMLKQQQAMMEGVSKGISNMSEKKIQQIPPRNIDGIPEKDAARIKQIPDKILSDKELVLFIKKVRLEVEKKLPESEKTKALQLYNEVKAKIKEPLSSGNLAAECWMVGASSMALYLMGKACEEDMTNTDNLNNYAAMLTMKGAEHAAIPILENLHNKFPGNSTILNNLGQAWYGLGEMNQAKKYLDSTVHFYRNHPQANETKSEIEKSEGNTQESVESLQRSIEEDFTPEKEARLIKLGGKIDCNHLTWSENDKQILFKYPKPAHPLGLEKFILAIPEYPMTLEDAGQNNIAWIEFKESLTVADDKLSNEMPALKSKYEQFYDQLSIPSKAKVLMGPYNNSIHFKAARKLRCLIEWGGDELVRFGKKLKTAEDSVQVWKDNYAEATKGDVDCSVRNAAAIEFISKSNLLWQTIQTELLTFYKEFTGLQATYFLYTTIDQSEYDLQINALKSQFLTMLKSLRYEWAPLCGKKEEEDQRRRGVLPDYDEVNCQYKTELNMHFTKINVECNKMTTTIEVGKFKGSLEENLATGKYNGRVEIKQEIGSDEWKNGPLKAEAQLSGKVGVEFNQDGVQDVYVQGEAEISVGATSIAGATARYGFISGKGSITGSGALSGISIR